MSARPYQNDMHGEGKMVRNEGNIKEKYSLSCNDNTCTILYMRQFLWPLSDEWRSCVSKMATRESLAYLILDAQFVEKDRQKIILPKIERAPK